MGFALCTFCSVCSNLRNLGASPSRSIARVVGSRLAGRVGASAPVTRFRGKHSRSHTGGRGTVLEKESGKYRSITIEPVDCHSYKILQSRVHSFTWFGAGKAAGFFFGTKFRLSTHLAIFSIDA